MNIVFVPTILTAITDVLLCILCYYGMKLEVWKQAGLLLLSSILSLVISAELLLYKAQKALAIPIFPKEDWSLLTTINRYLDLSSRILSLIAIGWLLLFVLRLKDSRDSNPRISGST